MEKAGVLSFEQERIWFLDRLEPGNPVYNRPCAIRITGPLRTDLLSSAIRSLVSRHDVIRACFPDEGGVPVQLIRPCRDFPVEFIDLLPYPPAERQEHAARILAGEAKHSFNLARDFLLRPLILRTAPDEHLLLLTFHHIIFDGWSMTNVLNELSDTYRALSQGLPPAAEELPLQYPEYAAAQRQRLSGETLREKLAYWRIKLSGELPILELSPVKPGSPFQSLADGIFHFTLPAGTVEGAKRLARQERATLFMILLTALKILLHRYSDQNDIIVGSTISGRTQSDTKPMVGLLINTLVLRTAIDEEMSFREALARVKKTTLEAYDHSDMPFEKLVAELSPPRTDNKFPFFQVLINMHNMPKADIRFDGMEWEEVEVFNGIDQVDLTLQISEKDGQLACTFIYNPSLFERAAVERMSGHLKTLLDFALEHPGENLRRIPLLSPPERQQLLCGFIGTRAEYPSDSCLQQIFEAQAERTPSAVALLYRDQRMTYAELNQRANRLAHYLKSLGVGPEVPVGISLERSMELIISFLAVLKAGGVYVPLDMKYPVDRLQYMAWNSNLALLLTHSAYSSRIALPGLRPVLLDQLQETLSEQSTENPALSTSAESNAYIMFTSGSTGRPKAMAAHHRGIIRMIFNPCFDFFNDRQVFLQLSSTSFDLSTTEIYGALLRGAKLAIIDSDMPSIEHIGEALRQHGVTTLCLGPEVLGLLIRERMQDLAGLEQVLCGGDVLPVNMALELLRRHPCRLLNLYGPTENICCSTAFEVPRDWPEDQPIPIGRPLLNDRVYILDRFGELVPVGVPGELHVAGDGLVAGYLGNEALTNEKFIRDPFADDGSRMYKTGDIVRFLPDGNIEFLGRRDHQVKIRGCRIELSEIETVLRNHPGVAQVLVTVNLRTPGMKSLSAYVVARENFSMNGASLRSYLQTKLPNYMIPSAFVFLDRMPLTPVGKVDRDALPDPDPAAAEETSARFVAPGNAHEKKMAVLWERVLDVRPISMTDSFFDLGGHSLLAMRLMAEVEKEFECRLSVSTIFTADTMEKMCAAIIGEREKEPSLLAPIQTRGTKPPLFCIHGGDGEVISFRNLSQYLGDDQPIYGVSFVQPVLNRIRNLSVESIAERYIQELESVDPHGPYYLAGYSFGGTVAYEMAQQLWRRGRSVALLVIFDTPNPVLFRQLNPPTEPGWLQWIKNRLRKLEYSPVGQRTLQFGEKARKEMLRLHLLPPDPDGKKLADRNARKRAKLIRRLGRVQLQYITREYPGKIVLFRSAAQSARRARLGEDLGWKKFAAGGLMIYESPGAHGDMINGQNIGFTAVQLRKCLEEARQGRSTDG